MSQKMLEKIEVHVNGVSAGILERRSQTAFSFHYHAHALDPDSGVAPVSMMMPIRPPQEPYRSGAGLHPVFAQNIPEGGLRNAIQDAYRRTMDVSDFGLLLLTGNRQIGGVSYTLPGQTLERKEEDVDAGVGALLRSNGIALSNKRFSDLLKQYLNSGISGVQPKFIADIDTKSCVLTPRFIVKSFDFKETPDLAVNEMLCLNVAREAGLRTADCQVTADKSAIVLRRFDLDSDGRRIGFEEMCGIQLKGCDRKYEGSWEGVVETANEMVSARHKKQARYDLMKLFVVNNVLRNTDAHLKNVGLLYDYKGAATAERRLAPAYDITTDVSYRLSERPALYNFEDDDAPRWATSEDLSKMARVCRLSAAQLDQVKREVSNAVVEVMDRMEVYYNKPAGKGWFSTYEDLRERWIEGMKHTLEIDLAPKRTVSP